MIQQIKSKLAAFHNDVSKKEKKIKPKKTKNEQITPRMSFKMVSKMLFIFMIGK